MARSSGHSDLMRVRFFLPILVVFFGRVQLQAIITHFPDLLTVPDDDGFELGGS